MADAAESGRTGLVLGATGLVGGHCLKLLLEDGAWSRVTVVARRPSGRTDARLREVTADFDRLDESADAFAADDVFCCLGTTIRQAGSQAAFSRVDHDYVVRAAELARLAKDGFAGVRVVENDEIATLGA